MKLIYLSLLFALTVLTVKAQNETNPAVEKFARFYKANQADSIFSLYSPEMKAAMKIESTTQFLAQVNGSLGAIVKTRFAGSPASGLSEYRLSFERPVVELALIIKDNLIAGIQQKAAEAAKNDPAPVESPDNFSVNNKVGDLHGTILLPKADGKVPVVLMIGGSGPTDRNMNQGQALKSNSFLMLAEGLAVNGIASIRYDKRGVGKSIAAHHPAEVKLDDFIDDAQLFVVKLKADPRFSKVIVLGHSEGSTIGLMASLATKPDAFISLSGVGSDIADVMKKQFKALAGAEDFKIAAEVLDSLKASKMVNRNLPPALSSIFTPSTQAFLISSMKYNVTQEISKLKIPVLIAGGSTDLQVAGEEAQLLAKANPKATLKLFTGMNHVLKPAPADRMLNIQTYNNPELPLHEELIPYLSGFINKIPGRK